jgi:hypothetical protein
VEAGAPAEVAEAQAVAGAEAEQEREDRAAEAVEEAPGARAAGKRCARVCGPQPLLQGFPWM